MGDSRYLASFLKPATSQNEQSMLHHIIYMSRGIQPMQDHELRALLEQAQQANAEQDITGALIYGDHQFMQIIEGEESRLASLYAKLLNDPRHTSVVKLADKQINERSFSSWSMAFHAASPEEFSELAGYAEPETLELKKPTLSAADTLLLEMMQSFVLKKTD
ncbi:BLUF domain-containing protein [Hymenobacter yonginensis]|uniref:BLUF domain-containing protein n=1 Tax=Hymenobacter yonginensis TaxID=748197 RepID=A0ABY7PSU9_9BACT|nr:BLUF domain-containing protein [Hymenobacter yonginensis]WBO85993.1 BLUF domain-containing protein [Hymenobacter yonginensis]